MKLILYLPFILVIYLYFYLTPLFEVMGIFNWMFDNYISFSIKCIKIIGLYDKIEFIGNIKMKSNKNLIIANHTSFLDNIVLMKLCYVSKFSFRNTKTVSRVSNKKYQNKLMSKHNNLLVEKNIVKDLSSNDKLFNNWKKYKKLSIIIFPEGTINTGKKKSITQKETQLSNKIFDDTNKKYENVLFPKSGIFNLLLKNFNGQLETLLDLTIIYTKNGKRLLGEKNIFKCIADDDFRIIVHIDKYKL